MLSRVENVSKPPQRLTLKQQKFVEAYVGAANGNATRAAQLAGYKGSEVTLQAVGSENLRKPLITSAIAQRTQKGLKKLNADKILAELARIAQGEDEEAKTSDRIRALELLGKNLALWVDRKEISGPDGGAVPVYTIELPEKQVG